MTEVSGYSAPFVIVVLLCICLIGGSFFLQLNVGQEASTDEYSYQNEGDNPQRRNRFRRVQIIIDWSSVSTKNVRLTITRNGEIADKHLLTGPVISIVVENMDAVIFNYKKCIEVEDVMTKIVLFLLVNIDRQTDPISILGKELTSKDLWTNDLIDNSTAKTQRLSKDDKQESQ